MLFYSGKRSPFVLGKCKSKVAKKPIDQLERLREWQKAREEAKAKSRSKKPVFAVRQVNRDTFVPKLSKSNSSLKSSFSTKKAILCMSPKPARPATVQSSTHSNRSVVSKKPRVPPPTKPNMDKKIKEPSDKPQRTIKQAKTAAGTTKKGSRDELKSSTTTTRHSTRLAMKHTAPAGGPARSSGARKASATKKPATSVAKKGARVADEDAAPKSVRTGKKKRCSPAKSQGSAKSGKGNHKSTKGNDSIAVPTTPVKKYEPACPSPLLHCRSASKLHREAMYCSKPFMGDDESAWMPGLAHVDGATNRPDFENAFDDSFSPFRFTAGSSSNQVQNAPFQFTFRMDPVPTQQPMEVPCPSHSISINSSLGVTDDYCMDENVSPSNLENLITFSDTFAREEEGEEAKQTPRRSTRNAARKNYNYSSAKRRSSRARVAGEGGSGPESAKAVKRGRKSRGSKCEVTSDSRESDVDSPPDGIESDGKITPSDVVEVGDGEVVGSPHEKREEDVVRNLEVDYDAEKTAEEGKS